MKGFREYVKGESNCREENKAQGSSLMKQLTAGKRTKLREAVADAVAGKRTKLREARL
jgi:hypothetical protein